MPPKDWGHRMYVGFFSPLHGAFTLVTYDESVMAVP